SAVPAGAARVGQSDRPQDPRACVLVVRPGGNAALHPAGWLLAEHGHASWCAVLWPASIRRTRTTSTTGSPQRSVAGTPHPLRSSGVANPPRAASAPMHVATPWAGPAGAPAGPFAVAVALPPQQGMATIELTDPLVVSWQGKTAREAIVRAG